MRGRRADARIAQSLPTWREQQNVKEVLVLEALAWALEPPGALPRCSPLPWPAHAHPWMPGEQFLPWPSADDYAACQLAHHSRPPVPLRLDRLPFSQLPMSGGARLLSPHARPAGPRPAQPDRPRAMSCSGKAGLPRFCHARARPLRCWWCLLVCSMDAARLTLMPPPHVRCRALNQYSKVEKE